VRRPVDRLQGGVLLIGAVVFYLLLAADGADVGFHWTPLVLGGVYLAAALLGGRSGSYWSTAVALVGFGLGPVAYYEYHADFSAGSLYVVAIGLAVLATEGLMRARFAVTTGAVGATILAAGILFAEQTHLDVITDPKLYAGLLAAVGVVRVVTGQRIPPARSSRSR
jgi:hypothetical protein